MVVESSEPVPARGGWKLWARLFVSAVLLAVLVNKAPSFDDLLPDQHHFLTVVLLGGAVATTLIGIVLSAWRWQRVLIALGHEVPLTTLFGHYLAGQFVGNALPSTIGGDVLRVSRVSTTIGSSTTGFASVVLERLTGFVVLPLIMYIGFAADPSILDVEHSWVALMIGVITMTVLLVLLYLAAHPRIAGRFAEHENWMRFIGAIHDSVDRLRREPKHALPILGTAFVYQCSVVLSVAFIFRALDLPIPLAAVCAYVPAVSMLQVIPVSFNGLGVREGALVFFLAPWPGVDSAQAIAVGVLWFFCTLAVSVLGAPSFAVGHRQRDRAEKRAE